MTTNKFSILATLVILATSLFCVAVHMYLLNADVLPQVFVKAPFVLMYLFLVPASLLTIWFVLWRFKKDQTSAGRAYFITVFFKMFGAAFFLYPGLIVKAPILKAAAVQFMAIFFLLLFIETILLVKLLNTPFDEK